MEGHLRIGDGQRGGGRHGHQRGSNNGRIGAGKGISNNVVHAGRVLDVGRILGDEGQVTLLPGRAGGGHTVEGRDQGLVVREESELTAF